MRQICYNQDGSCICIPTDKGFRILNSSDASLRFERTNLGPLSLVQLLNNTNIVALVGSENNIQYPPTRVVIWDDAQVRAIAEISSSSIVKNIYIRRDRLVIVLETRVCIYRFSDLKLVQEIKTGNKHGVIACSPADPWMIAVPGETPGTVHAEYIDTEITIQAHQHDIAQLAFHSYKPWLATASVRGTIIRVFSVLKGDLLAEFRRGFSEASIHSLSWSTERRLAVTSNKNTLHIFDLPDPGNASWFGRSTKQFPVFPERVACSFVSGNILVASSDADYYRYNLEATHGFVHIGL